MDGGAVMAAGSFALLAAVLLGVAQMAGTGALPRNGAIGIRTSATRASDAAWMAGHRAASGGLRLIGWLCLLAAGLVVVPALVLPASIAASGAFGLALLGYLLLVVGMVLVSRRASAAARRAP